MGGRSVISAYFPRPPEFDIDFAPLSGSTGLTVPRHSRNLGGLAAPKNGLGPLLTIMLDDEPPVQQKKPVQCLRSRSKHQHNFRGWALTAI